MAANDKTKDFDRLVKEVGKMEPDKVLDWLIELIDPEKSNAQWVSAAYIVLLQKLGK